MDTLKSFWITPEDQFINVESAESTSIIALVTTPVAESGKTPVTTNNKSPPLPSKPGLLGKPHQGQGQLLQTEAT
jgi:hypothetical protein